MHLADNSMIDSNATDSIISIPQARNLMRMLGSIAMAHQIVKEDGELYRNINALDCIVIGKKKMELIKNEMS